MRGFDRLVVGATGHPSPVTPEKKSAIAQAGLLQTTATPAPKLRLIAVIVTGARSIEETQFAQAGVVGSAHDDVVQKLDLHDLAGTD